MKNNSFTLFLGFILAIAAVICIADTPLFVPGNSNLSIQTGYAVTAGSNNLTITFATPFSAPPQVVSTLLNATSATNYITSIASNSFNWNSGTSGISNSWIAIGPR